MDLADIWQEHKKFIIAVAAALLLLLVGGGVISGKYPVDSVERQALRINSELRRNPEIKRQFLEPLRDEVTDLRQRYEELVLAMDFDQSQADSLENSPFVLPPNEPNPTSFCWNTIRVMQRTIVDDAERVDIRIPEKLGLQDAAPTDLEEIKRTLRALNIISNVVTSCIAARIDEVKRIHIEPRARGRSKSSRFIEELRVEFEIVGYERSLRQVLANVVENPKRGNDPYLEVATPTAVEPYKHDQDMLLMRLTVAGLSIHADELLEDA